MGSRTRVWVAGLSVVTLLGATAPEVAGPDDAAPAQVGRMVEPFQEPTVGGVETDATCVEREDGTLDCKPTAGSLAVLATGDADATEVVYWNALEGTENVRGSIVAEFGQVSINAQARRLTLGPDDQTTFVATDAVDSGVNDGGIAGETILPNGVGNTSGSSPWNDGSLFCSDLVQLADGRVLAVGGTAYYSEPGIEDSPVGVVELEGLDSTRIYDPATNTWTEAPSMQQGRWYPSMTTLADGSHFVSSGTTKLLKPVYPERPLDSGTNVTSTEIRDIATGEWRESGPAGDRSLPLYPRQHLLPNGHVYYNTGGQVFNPMGQAYDMALWNIAASFDPRTRSWTDLGIPGLAGLEDMSTPEDAEQVLPSELAAGAADVLARGGDTTEALTIALADQDLGEGVRQALGLASAQGLEGLGNVLGAGFRGSTFSLMLPLRPDPETGAYEEAEFLTAGGVIGTTPGTYAAVPFSRVDTVRATGQGSELVASRFTESLQVPRWYGTAVGLPTGQVLLANGGTSDEVVAPGSGMPVTRPELFDPVSGTWTQMAEADRPRNYHSTAALLPDGRVMLGGHDQISTLYASNVTLPGGFTPDGRDQTFEIFEPPYLHFDVDQPAITELSSDELQAGDTFTVATDVPVDEVDSVSLVRNAAITHLVDGDQRTVELRITDRGEDGQLEVAMPEEAGAVPPGPYLLFVNRASEQGLVPSVAEQIVVPLPDGAAYGGPEQDRSGIDHEPADPGLNPAPFLSDVVGGGPDVHDGGANDADGGDGTEDGNEGGDARPPSPPGGPPLDPGPPVPPQDVGPPEDGDRPDDPGPRAEGTVEGDDGPRAEVGAGPDGVTATATPPSSDPSDAEVQRIALARAQLLGEAPAGRGGPLTLAVVLLAVAVLTTRRAWRDAGPG